MLGTILSLSFCLLSLTFFCVGVGTGGKNEPGSGQMASCTWCHPATCVSGAAWMRESHRQSKCSLLATFFCYQRLWGGNRECFLSFKAFRIQKVEIVYELDLYLIVHKGQSQEKFRYKDDPADFLFGITLLLSSQDFSPEQLKNKKVLWVQSFL